MIKTQTYYINRRNKQIYYVYDIATYMSDDTNFTCVIYAPCSISYKKSKGYYVRSIDDFKAKFYKKRESKKYIPSFLWEG